MKVEDDGTRTRDHGVRVIWFNLESLDPLEIKEPAFRNHDQAWPPPEDKGGGRESTPYV